MTIAVQIIAILFMLTLIFIGIWSFIIANKAYNQLKYKNYLLEKIGSQLALITENSLSKDNPTNDKVSTSDIAESYVVKEEILNLSKELDELPSIFELEKRK